MTSSNSLRFQARPTVLCILDGWGWNEDRENNAVAQAHTPAFDHLLATCPMSFLKTSGADVGLPDGQMGNSEVGHMNIGAGRIVLQDLPRIDRAIEDGSLVRNPVLTEAIAKLKDTGGTAHVIGLLSPGGVHSHQRHMAAIAHAIADAGVEVKIHGFLDGRDTPPRSADGFVSEFVASLNGHPKIAIASLCGRYYAMDRDKRWERTQLAYDAMVDGRAETRADSPQDAIRASYDADTGDEFVRPASIGDYQGMADGDAVIAINFRADRMRQIMTALLDPHFDGFDRNRIIRFSAQAGMTEYSAALNALMPALFPPEDITKTIGEVTAAHGLKQLRLAETEKYAHVTYFLNGGLEDVYEGEDRVMVQSPKVATYDLKPEMSAAEVTAELVNAIRSRTYDLIVVNYANPDMVGHTGILEAVIKAVEAVDQGLGQVVEAVREVGGVMFVTADHGNAEMLWDPVTNGPHTAHTKFVVPAFLVNTEVLDAPVSLADGRLADIAPTLLALMGIDQPAEMTGQSLLRRADQDTARESA